MKRALFAVTMTVLGVYFLLTYQPPRLPPPTAAVEPAAQVPADGAPASPPAGAPPSPSASASPSGDGEKDGKDKKEGERKGDASGSSEQPSPDTGDDGGQPDEDPPPAPDEPDTPDAPAQPKPSSEPPAPKPDKPEPPPPSARRTVDGPLIPTDYGPVQVRITMDGDRLADVSTLAMPSQEFRSQEISATAGPQLRDRALAAQSAQIDTVSGATYTSEGYRTSLQGALDKARG